MIITKSFQFEMAHMLDGHDGKCQNLHGHTYTLVIGIKGTPILSGPKEGMIMDYGDIKNIVNDFVISKLDHSFVFNEKNEIESQIAKILINNNRKVYGISN